MFDPDKLGKMLLDEMFRSDSKLKRQIDCEVMDAAIEVLGLTEEQFDAIRNDLDSNELYWSTTSMLYAQVLASAILGLSYAGRKKAPATVDDTIDRYAKKIEGIIAAGTVGDYTFTGVLAEFAREIKS